MSSIKLDPIQSIVTKNAATPLGHYSQAVVHKEIVYVSGQLGIDPKNPDHVPDTVAQQTHQTLANIQAVLLAAGSDKSRVLKATIYISDISFWAEVNQIYATFFGDHKPARCAVPTKDLPKGFLVEIDVIAAQT